MIKKKRFLFFLIFIAGFLVLYLIISSDPIEKNENAVEHKNEIDKEDLLSNYRNQSSQIVKDYYHILLGKQISSEQIADFKSRLLELKVPVEYKNVHLQLILAVSKMENYIVDKNEREWSESLEMLNQTISENSWLSI